MMVISPARFGGGGGGGPSLWTPANYTGGFLESWHDPSSAAGITLVSGLVSQDNDLSGNGYHDTQAVSTTRPAYVTGALNGLAIEDFANVTGAPYFSTTLPSNPAIRTCMALAYWDGSGTDTLWGSQSPGGLQFRVDSGNPSLVKQASALIANGTGALIASSTWAIIVASYNQSTGAYAFRVNGTPCGSGTNVQSLGAFGSYVGIQSPPSSEAWGGKIAERATLTVATTAQIELFEGYVAWKYGLQANLDAGHPYKSAAPTYP